MDNFETENLQRRIDEKGDKVKRILEERRLRKWTLTGKERRRPRLSGSSLASLRLVLEEAEEFNGAREQLPVRREERAEVRAEPEEESTRGPDNPRGPDGEVETQPAETNRINEENRLAEDEENCARGFVSRNVVNLSDRVLTNSEIKVLSRGLNFCPTPNEINKYELAKDLSEFSRIMKCKAYFAGVGEVGHKKSDRETRFKSKSTWAPDRVDPALELFLNNLSEKVLSIGERGNNFSNLDQDEKRALKDLKGYKDIIIKGADKGSAVVVWGKNEYCQEACKQLGDTLVYESIKENPIEKVLKIIDKKLISLKSKGVITQENYKYLKGRDKKLGRFYLLPKIHKRLVDVPGRPVISNCGTPTEGISEFVDFYLQPIVMTLPRVIKDTTDFLCRLRDLGDMPENAIICTMDVVGLYPHIPHAEGLESMKEKVEIFQSTLDPDKVDITVGDIVDLAKLILENNYFEFDNNIYRQKLGTAIGTRFAPSFANMFMSSLEDNMLKECRLKPWVWWRFLDDIFFVWLHGRESLVEFFEYINAYHETIKYTWEWSENKLSYLDVLVKVEGKKIATDVFCKPTDTRQYLDNRSCHPRHVKQGIPYGQALRIRRICNSNDVFERRLSELSADFVKRGFKKNVIDSQFRRAKERSRDSLLRQENSRNINNRVALVVNYHPALSKINGIIDRLWPVLHASQNMKKVFEVRPLVSYRRPRNLKDELVRSKIKKEDIHYSKGMKKCGKARCQICKFVDEGNTFGPSNRKYYINFAFDCDSEGVIYIIVCRKCNKIYVGSTITSFRKRFNNHKSSLIRYGKGQRAIPGEHLYAHFFEIGHTGLEDVSVKIIDKTNINEPTNREGFWTYKLNSFIPMGLNLRDFF